MKKEADLAVAVPVQSSVQAIGGFDKVVIPASRVAFTTHYGQYYYMIPAYEILN